MLLPDKILSKKQAFDVRYFLLFSPNHFKMRQSLIVLKFLVEAQGNSLRLHQLYYKLLVLIIKHSMWVFWETLLYFFENE
jgi:hypothetical protein